MSTEPVKKEVLMIFGCRRRPVAFDVIEGEKEEALLLAAAKEVFSDVLDPDDTFYFQAPSEKWADHLVDLRGTVPDCSVVHLFQEPTSTSKVML